MGIISMSIEMSDIKKSGSEQRSPADLTLCQDINIFNGFVEDLQSIH